MNRWVKRMVWLLPLLVMLGGFMPVAWADDDDDDEHGPREEEAWSEEAGEFLGWGTAALFVAAGTLMPLRRMQQPLRKQAPQAQKALVPVTKWMGQTHMWIGIGAVLFSVVHGIMMYMAEEELGVREWIGIGASGLMIAAGLLGAVMWKEKTKVASLKGVHIGILTVVGLLAVTHILLS